MNIRNINYKLFTNIRSRNKSKPNFSLKKSHNYSFNNPKIHHSQVINNYKNFKNLNSYDALKSTNIYSDNNFTKVNFNTMNFFKLNRYDNKNILKSAHGRDKNTKLSLQNEGTEITKKFLGYDKKINFIKENSKKINYNFIKYKKDENDMKDKLCLLPRNFSVRNFNLKASKVIKYLDLNKDNKFFIYNSDFSKNKKEKNLFNKNKILPRAKSVLNLNKIKEIEDIYPAVLNIEGHKNFKILNDLELESKRKRKNERHNSIYYIQNFNLRKKMVQEKNTAEEYYKANISNMTYRRQLLLLYTKIYQKALAHLRKKNSFKFHLDLPLYNLFLNLD